ncbi:MAG: pre-mRNA cleavage and polyadenylation factor (CPF) complex subunit [Peltula sp. TS41687]|nr:MAG: pre-mRNA cleavage and polyadenylation factor (CPF) complex subunit [Peltula sp. TS41687]
MERDYGPGYGAGAGAGHDWQFARGRNRRPITDYTSMMVHWMRHRRPPYKGAPWTEFERPSLSYMADMLPPAANPRNAAETIPVKHLHSSLNKIKHPINVVRWTPEGRRLLTGSSSGEFTLWNGMAFNFETIMQAHDSAIRAACYSHSDDWLLSADQDGMVKYWQPNFNNVKVIQAHNDPIRDLAYSPTDSKFVTASDDSTLKIFDFAGGVKESTLTGHNWDAKSVDWHPTKGLIVSGSKDHLIKLWDPRTGRCLTTLRGHKNTISKTLFEPTRGQLLATCARDQTARIFDLRMMRDICLLRGHDKDISTLAWHPVHVNLLSTGGTDGSLFHYLLDEPNAPAGGAAPTTIAPYDSPDPSIAPAQTIYPAHRLPFAHEFAIWSLDWHPLGHVLASGSNDRITRFWTRPRPGELECFNDRFHIGDAAAEAQGTYDRRGMRKQQREQEEQEIEDEAEGLVDQQLPLKQQQQQQKNIPGIPGLPGTGTGTTSATAAASGDAPPMAGGESHQSQIPGMGNLPPPQPSGTPQGFTLPAFDPANPPDLAKLASLVGMRSLPQPGQGPPSHPLPPGLLPQGYQLQHAGPSPPQPPPPVNGGSSIPGLGGSGGGGGGGGAGVRKRGPLPSQQESLAMEQRQGKYRSVR